MAALVLAIGLWQALSGASTEPVTRSESSSTSTGGRAAAPAASSTTPPAADPTVSSSAATSPADAPATHPVSPAPEPTGPATGTPAPAVPSGAQEAASGFVTAWARPSVPAEQWLAGVRGYLAPDLERSMSYTDPTRIPASKVIGPARMVHVLPDATGASFEVPTDAGPIRVEVVLVEGRWLASDVAPAAVTAPGD
ncbi:hypothetical protein ACFQU3_20365 [Terrabacter sp. GCM10028922]|uniref:hypothetical protein n=1 Tax=Terrabacter sp. GCM10028922 TaxID=3273428 RepID=UPI00362032E3